MAGSTSSMSNQVSSARRRAIEKNHPTAGSNFATCVTALNDNNAAKISSMDTDAKLLRDEKNSLPQFPVRKSNPNRKPPKPRWLTVVSILAKNIALLVFILGLIQMARWTVMKSGRDTEGFAVISGDFDGKFAEVEKFVKTTMRAMQVQVNAIDKKIDDGVSLARKEFHERIDKNGKEVELKLMALDARSDVLQKFMDGFRKKSFLSKEEFGEFFEEFKNSRNNGVTDVSLDDIKEYARAIVEKEIEKHAADGLGMVDYALASGGGRVIKHSEVYGAGKGSGLMNRNKVATEAQKVLTPSFGEPGECFPLKGDSGFVVIRLRTAILPEAVTIEHVAKTVAFDRSSAPKHCRISGWLQGQALSGAEVDYEKLFLLAEFIYDLDKSNAQTFKMLNSAVSMVVDTIRLDFTSNHGSASHTCIYRLRVHGHEHTSIPLLKMQP